MSELIKNDGVDNRWVDIVVDLALKTVRSVVPNPKNGDKMDIRNYVKVHIVF